LCGGGRGAGADERDENVATPSERLSGSRTRLSALTCGFRLRIRTLPSQEPGRFELADLFRFAGVLASGATTPTYVVVAGDTLFSIAQEQLVDATRWPETFAMNGDVLTKPDVLVAGQVLQLPAL